MVFKHSRNTTVYVVLYHFVWAVQNYTMAVRDFADIYTQTPRAAGQRSKGVYISKITTQSWYISLYTLT